ncbi:MAG: TIR domain-containing protein [Anaerolineaceae bacterium]|nr:TIR domain-containing protein [Anaerolineaceae bacterium]
MATIFFSYAHEDLDQVTRIKDVLEARGHEILMDVSFQAGGSFPKAIDLAIETCDFFAIFLTRNSIHSHWVNIELDIYLVKEGNTAQETILPIKLDDTDIGSFRLVLQTKHYCDFTQSFEAGLRDVLSRLRRGTSNLTSFSEEDYQRLVFAIEVAIDAGHAIMMHYNRSLKDYSQLDQRKNAATHADTAAENKVIRLIESSEYRDETIISEEAAKTLPYEALFERVDMNGYTWVIDPLDGTSNFVSRLPFFCSAIGVLKHGLPFIGALFDPVANEVYYACEGQQSRLWKISTGETTPISADSSIRTLHDAAVATHISTRQEVADKLFQNDLFRRISKACKFVRALGCGQLAMAYVASGRLHSFFQLDGYMWDQVASTVIVNNARNPKISGAVVKEFDLNSGQISDWTYRSRNILACSNEDIFQSFTSILQEDNR